jgi:hypothetical protein
VRLDYRGDVDSDRIIANDVRRDSPNIVQNDGFACGLDIFHGRRSG